MAFKLDKQEIARRDGLVTDLTEARSKLEDAISTYNDAMSKLQDPLNDVLKTYNEALEAARGFAEDIASQADGDIDDKSDKWREGDKGQEATEWKDAWERAALDDLEITFPEDLSIDDADDHAVILSELPVEAG